MVISVFISFLLQSYGGKITCDINFLFVFIVTRRYTFFYGVVLEEACVSLMNSIVIT